MLITSAIGQEQTVRECAKKQPLMPHKVMLIRYRFAAVFHSPFSRDKILEDLG